LEASKRTYTHYRFETMIPEISNTILTLDSLKTDSLFIRNNGDAFAKVRGFATGKNFWKVKWYHRDPPNRGLCILVDAKTGECLPMAIGF